MSRDITNRQLLNEARNKTIIASKLTPEVSDTINPKQRKTLCVAQAVQLTNQKNQLQILKNCINKMKNLTYTKQLNALSFNEKQIYSDKASSFADVLIPGSTLQRMQSKQEIDIMKSSNGADKFRKLIMELIEQKKKIKNQRFFQIIKRTLSQSIMPNNTFIMVWYILIILVILYEMISLPLQDAFPIQFKQFESQYFIQFVFIEFVILLFDIILQFNISIFHQGNIIENKKEIAQMYLKKGLVEDILALIGFLFARSSILFQTKWQFNILSEIFKYLFLLKNGRLIKLLDFFQSEVCINKTAKNYLDLTYLLLLVVTMSHYIACFWIILANYSSTFYQENNWIDSQQNPFNTSVFVYLQSMYFACMTMTTVGYGDIQPKNPIEYLGCIGIMLFSCGLFAYSLNTITSILVNIKQQKKQYLKEIEIMENYMRKRKIPQNLGQRIKNYLKCMHKAGINDDQSEEDGVICKLSKQLQEQLNLQDKGKIFDRIPEVINNLSKDCILKLIDQIEEIRLFPGETVQLHQEQFIYIIRGKINAVFSQQQQKLFTLKQGDHYGQEALFGKSYEQPLYLKSEDFSIVYSLNKQSVEKAVHLANIEDKEKYCQLRDSVLIYNVNVEQECKLCLQHNHNMKNCPKYFLQPNREYVIKKYEYSQNQARQRLQSRKINMKFNTFQNLFTTSRAAYDIMISVRGNEEEEQSEESQNESHQEDEKEEIQENDIQLKEICEQDEESSKQQFSSREKQLSSDLQPQSSRSWHVEEEHNLKTNSIFKSNQKKQVSPLHLKIPKIPSSPDKKVSILKKQGSNRNLTPTYQKNQQQQPQEQHSLISQDSPNNKRQKYVRMKSQKENTNKIKRRTISRANSQQQSQIHLSSTINNNMDIDKLVNLVRQITNQQEDKLDLIDVKNDFEKGAEYQYYFPKNNMTYVLKKVNKQRKDLEKKLRQKINLLTRKSIREQIFQFKKL